MAAPQLFSRLEEHARQRPDVVAYRFAAETAGCQSLTWRQLHEATCYWASQFSAHLKPGETLLICSPNRLEMVIAILAGFSAGLRVFPVSAEMSEVELLRLARESAAVGGVCAQRAKQTLASSLTVLWPIEQITPQSVRQHAPEAGDLILQSSGTTGFPRLVLRRGHSLDAVSSAMARAIDFRADDRVLAMLPLSHSYGLEHGLLAPVWAGSSVVLGQGLDIRTVARELSDGATIFPTVPSVIEILSDLPGTSCGMPALRRIYSAGGPLPRSVYDRFQARYARRVSQLYGATEVGSITFNSDTTDDFDPGSVGIPFQGVSIRIVDPLNPQQALPFGQEGHIIIRADSMFDGYLDEQSSLLDGHFPTGDLGRLDESGRLTITGRLKLLIDVGGVKVNPIEVEAVLREHPDVSLCVVIPVRQSETVYRIKAIATPRDPTRPPTIEALRSLARQRLATYKIPRVIEIRASLPTTATGKVLRHLVENP